MSMEPSSWVVPCYPGWSMEEAAAWSSDHRISFQTPLPSHSDSVQLQVVECAAPPTPTHDTCSDPIQVFNEVVDEVHANYLEIMEKKMHKFPPSLVDVHPRYTQPLSVAIGPYHHGHPGMMEAEQMKNVAADQCVRDSARAADQCLSDSACLLQAMYNAVFTVLPDALKLYYPDELAKFHKDILPMMFLDACFLVQFMRWYDVPEDDMDRALGSYFCANFERISTDIMMLENQIPWIVVKTIFSFMPPAPSSPCLCPWDMFVFAMRRGLKNQMEGDDIQLQDIVDDVQLQDIVDDVQDIDDVKDDDFQDIDDVKDIVEDPEYEPPHLLALVRFHIVGKYDEEKNVEVPTADKPMSLSISVAELADVGITLVPKTGTEAVLADMRLRSSKWGCFSDLFVPPLCLTEANATTLVNMAAFELCKTPDFGNVGAEDSAVCSYLHLFAMLLDQERHVQDLRKQKVIEGGGLTSKETLQFFTSIGKNMRLGKSYIDIIIEIDEFKRKRSFLLKAYLFLMKHWTKIIAVTTVIGAVAGILSSLQNLKTKQPKT